MQSLGPYLWRFEQGPAAGGDFALPPYGWCEAL